LCYPVSRNHKGILNGFPLAGWWRVDRKNQRIIFENNQYSMLLSQEQSYLALGAAWTW